MDPSPEQLAPLQAIAAELEATARNRAELEAQIALLAREQQAEIDAQNAAIAAAKARIAELGAEIREVAPVAAASLDKANASFDALKKQLRDAAKALPPEVLNQGGIKLQAGDLKVGISKVTASAVYDGDALLHAHPALEKLEYEGKPLLRRTVEVDAAVLEELVKTGLIDDATIAPFRTLVAGRSPSIRIS